MPWRALLALIVVALAAAACGDDSTETAGPVDEVEPWGPLAVVDPGDGHGQALVSGVLLIDDGCVTLDERGDEALLVWPSDRTGWDPGSGVVLFETLAGEVVELAAGDHVSFSGGGDSADEGGPAAEEFISQRDWVSAPDVSCVAPTRWFIGDLVDSGADGESDEPAADAPIPSDLETAEFTLHVSNQSFEDSSVAITVTIDGVTVVDDRFEVENQHNWVVYDLELAAGSHELIAVSDTGVELVTSFDSDGEDPLWGVVNYWWYPDDPRHFTFETFDERVQHA